MECPPNHYNNCKNSLRLCRACKAGPGRSAILRYDPKEDLGPHPLESKTNHFSKAGRKAEERTHQRINKKLEKTKASGSQHGDGDFRILGDLRGEHKLRITRTSIGLSWSEYLKGLRQGIDHWFLTVKKDQEHHFVIMTEDSYIDLISRINPNSSSKE